MCINCVDEYIANNISHELPPTESPPTELPPTRLSPIGLSSIESRRLTFINTPIRITGRVLTYYEHKIGVSLIWYIRDKICRTENVAFYGNNSNELIFIKENELLESFSQHTIDEIKQIINADSHFFYWYDINNVKWIGCFKYNRSTRLYMRR
jgi:hypothetical protein